MSESLFERLIPFFWIVESVEGHQASDESEASGRDIEAPGPLAQQAAPVTEPFQGAFHQPAPLEHDEALLVGLRLDDAMAHAVPVAPLLAAFGREGSVQERQAQAWPRLRPGIQRRQGVTILPVGGHDNQPQDMPFGIHHDHALAPNNRLGSVVAARSAHPETLTLWVSMIARRGCGR